MWGSNTGILWQGQNHRVPSILPIYIYTMSSMRDIQCRALASIKCVVLIPTVIITCLDHAISHSSGVKNDMALLVLVDHAVFLFQSFWAKLLQIQTPCFFSLIILVLTGWTKKQQPHLSQTAVLPYTYKTTEVEMNVHTVQKQYKGWYCMHCTHQLQAALWCFDFKLILKNR